MMSVSKRQPSSSTEVDPLLRDLSEKKQSFRQNVVSLVAELKEVRGRLASQEQSSSTKIVNREEAETKAKTMQEELRFLQKNLEERTDQLQASTSAAEMYVNELGDLKRQFAATKATAENSALSAESAKSQCSALAEVIKEKNRSLHDHEICVSKLKEQLDRLQRDLQARDFFHAQLKDEVLRIEHEMMQAIGNAGSNKDHELRKMLDDVTPRNLGNINQVLTVKDQEIANLRDEIRITSAHCRLKTKEMESQLEKHHRADKELKTKVMKLEFCFHEARAQIRKLQRMGERRDQAIKELRDELAAKQQPGEPLSCDKLNFWETSQFKIVISISMLALVMFSKR